jgi:5-methylcytosine-specific restriction endonuclease McrA
MGGTEKDETIENLMALCREHHNQMGDRKQFKEYLKEVHQRKLNGNK